MAFATSVRPRLTSSASRSVLSRAALRLVGGLPSVAVVGCLWVVSRWVTVSWILSIVVWMEEMWGRTAPITWLATRSEGLESDVWSPGWEGEGVGVLSLWAESCREATCGEIEAITWLAIVSPSEGGREFWTSAIREGTFADSRR